ncbi:polysaccharide deacetylase family protein [Kitasatospora sp. GAS1066B]|uniref:polysaccharide deacetylase family protein n=1 Tax=Kitasatospora sp. GAS1066B TaxID=3156271 RepID=UPI00351129AE
MRRALPPPDRTQPGGPPGTSALFASIRLLQAKLTLPEVNGRGDPTHVALTFDDGPDPASTPRFLRVLDRAGIRATFFMLGQMVVQQPALAKEMVAAGHEVAVHGYRHRLLVTRTPGAVRDDIARARDVIADLTGSQPRWYRPPYGVLTISAVATATELGLVPVLWSSWGRDWSARATPGSVHRSVIRSLDGGGTVLLHDSDCTSDPGAWLSALGALPYIIDNCRTRGLRIGPLRDHNCRSAASWPSSPAAGFRGLGTSTRSVADPAD